MDVLSVVIAFFSDSLGEIYANIEESDAHAKSEADACAKAAEFSEVGFEHAGISEDDAFEWLVDGEAEFILDEDFS